MVSQTLSQEEIDALMAGSSGEEPAAAEAAPAEEGGVRAYDLSMQERIVRGRMPTLEIVNERFARHLRIGAFNFIQRNPDIAVGPVKMQKFSAFVREVAMPANINVMHLRPLRGMGLAICDPQLVFTVIDNLFGGGQQAPVRVEGREFSATEQRIIQRLAEVIANEYSRSWEGIHPLRMEHARSEMHMQFATVASPSEIVVTTTFDVHFGEHGGPLHLCIPYSTFEPIREVLDSPLRGDQGGADRRWGSLLTEQIRSATVELVAELATTNATVRQLMALKRGDFIELDRAPTLTCKVDGVPLLECDYGAVGPYYGLRVREFLTHASGAQALHSLSTSPEAL